jgi:hypothetical protein
VADPIARAANDEDAGFGEAAITLWSNTITLVATHMIDSGTPRQEVLDMLIMLNDTNQATIGSARARAVSEQRLMAVYKALGES